MGAGAYARCGLSACDTPQQHPDVNCSDMLSVHEVLQLSMRCHEVVGKVNGLQLKRIVPATSVVRWPQVSALHAAKQQTSRAGQQPDGHASIGTDSCEATLPFVGSGRGRQASERRRGQEERAAATEQKAPRKRGRPRGSTRTPPPQPPAKQSIKLKAAASDPLAAAGATPKQLPPPPGSLKRTRQPRALPKSSTPQEPTPGRVTPADLTPGDVTPADVTPEGATPADLTPEDLREWERPGLLSGAWDFNSELEDDPLWAAAAAAAAQEALQVAAGDPTVGLDGRDEQGQPLSTTAEPWGWEPGQLASPGAGGVAATAAAAAERELSAVEGAPLASTTTPPPAAAAAQQGQGGHVPASAAASAGAAGQPGAGAAVCGSSSGPDLHPQQQRGDDSAAGVNPPADATDEEQDVLDMQPSSSSPPPSAAAGATSLWEGGSSPSGFSAYPVFPSSSPAPPAASAGGLAGDRLAPSSSRYSQLQGPSSSYPLATEVVLSGLQDPHQPPLGALHPEVLEDQERQARLLRASAAREAAGVKRYEPIVDLAEALLRAGYTAEQLQQLKLSVELALKPADLEEAQQALDELVLQINNTRCEAEALEWRVAQAREGRGQVHPTDVWRHSLEALRAFVQLAGRLPYQEEVFRNLYLGKWCRQQQLDYEKGMLTQQQVQQLEAVSAWGWEQPIMQQHQAEAAQQRQLERSQKRQQRSQQQQRQGLQQQGAGSSSSSMMWGEGGVAAAHELRSWSEQGSVQQQQPGSGSSWQLGGADEPAAAAPLQEPPQQQQQQQPVVPTLLVLPSATQGTTSSSWDTSAGDNLGAPAGLPAATPTGVDQQQADALPAVSSGGVDDILSQLERLMQDVGWDLPPSGGSS